MIAITGDIHCHNHQQFKRILPDGTNSRLQDALDCLMWMAQTARDKGCKWLVVAGDLFHTRKSVENSVIDRVCRGFVEAQKAYGGVIFVLPGNHDYSVTGDGSMSIRAVHDGSRVLVLDKPVVHEGVAFLPYTEDPDEVKSYVIRFLKKEARYLISHLGIVGSVMGPGDFEAVDCVEPDMLKAKKFKGVFLGHFHKHQVLPCGAVYVGSPLQLSYEERFETKGFVLLDEKTGGWSFETNTFSPRFVELKIGDKKTTYRSKDYVKVVATEDDDVEKALAGISAENVKVEVKKEARQFKARMDLADKGDREVLEEYVSHNPFKESTKVNKLLIQQGLELLNSVR